MTPRQINKAICRSGNPLGTTHLRAVAAEGRHVRLLLPYSGESHDGL